MSDANKENLANMIRHLALGDIEAAEKDFSAYTAIKSMEILGTAPVEAVAPAPVEQVPEPVQETPPAE